METRQLAVFDAKEKALFGRISVTQAIRHALQLIGFLLMPGLFILGLGACKGLWQAALNGNFTWTAMGAHLLALLAIIPVTALWGRFFCGYLCAFGGMQELIGFIGKKLRLPKLRITPQADRIMRKAKYGVLAVLFVLWTFSISYDYISPWSVFGQYSNYKGWSDLSGWITVGGQFLIAIILFSLFVERGFCRYLCPLGGVFSLISRGRLFKVKGNGSCVGCGKCDSACPMGVNVSAEAGGAIPGGSVKSSECIDCFRCVEQCGRKALYSSPREAVAGSAAALAITGIYQIGAITVNSPVAGITNPTAASQGKYIDGTYEGSAQGYRGEVKVKVKVSGGQITSIDVESYSDDEQFFNRAKNTVINEILSGQTTDVQAVSGATFSSRGIIQAVANALGVTSQSSELETLPNEHGHGFGGFGENGGDRKRPGSSEDGDNGRDRKKPDGSNYGGHKNRGHHRSAEDSNANADKRQENNSDKNNTQNASQNANLDFSNLKNGTYTGTGQGRNGSIEVTVKVKNNKATSITIESSREDSQYMNKAKDTVIGEIINAQSLNVKTVSGATMSSNGIIEAVANALGMEYTNTNSQFGGRGSHRGH